MIPRASNIQLRQYIRTFPVVLVSGPRQSGKTTLVRSVLKKWQYFDLERTRDIELIEADLEGFLEQHSSHVIFDEAQRLPKLFPALRSFIDRRGVKSGQFVLTGSARLSWRSMAGESLAGRIGNLELTPFRCDELKLLPHALRDRWFWGGFPPLYRIAKNAGRLAWLYAYIDSFLNTDIPAFGIRVPALRLKKLWTMLAHCHGGLLNASELGKSLGLSHHTVMAYIDILESAFMIRRLQPFYANVSKRLVKSPKIYVRDTGILHNLLGLRASQDLESHPKRGNSWEGFVIEEIITRTRSRFEGAGFYFWRTHAGGEVDLLIDFGTKKIALEIKAGYSVDTRTLVGIKNCMQDLGLKEGYVIYRGKETLRLAQNLMAIPWDSIAKGGLLWQSKR